ncbi:MAG: AAA family ATPase, partial [Candidatus Micrarchaeota archaeon]
PVVRLSDSFKEILSRESVFFKRDVLSPHYIPGKLPHREKEIERIMRSVSPGLQGEKPRNLFIYGKTGTGKTSTVKYVLNKLNEEESGKTVPVSYINCRLYGSRYKVMQKIVQDHLPEFAKPGYGISFFYEKMLDWIEGNVKQLIIVLDEVDMVKDLDDLLYTLTRANDDLKAGGVSILGISNRLNFKERLDPRSMSSLLETEIVFSPYNSKELVEILDARSKVGFAKGAVDESAINLASAIAAQENGDARYALKLLLRGGEIADEQGEKPVTDKHVEEARRSVDEGVTADAISTLPDHQQIVLYAIAKLTLRGSRYSRLGSENGEGENYLLSGEVYEDYAESSKKFRKIPRSARWFRQYLNDLEMLGLITMVNSGKGQRGHTRFIKIAYSAAKVKGIVEKRLEGE